MAKCQPLVVIVYIIQPYTDAEGSHAPLITLPLLSESIQQKHHIFQWII